MDDTLTLIASLHKQNQQILDELRQIRQEVKTSVATVDPDDRWVNGFKQLKTALETSGMFVSERRLCQFRACDVLRVSESEDLEVRDMGTGDRRSSWRFHVGRCKAAIARFERLPVEEKRRILGQ